MKGGYLLIIRLPEKHHILTGCLGKVYFPAGWYVYAGSALGGLEGRIAHHLKDLKKPHWHIDYLLGVAGIQGVLVIESGVRIECAIAQVLKTNLESVPGFGCSDCRCSSHLFYARSKEKLYSKIIGLEITHSRDNSGIPC